jgi:hypothetical protein
MMFKPAPGKVNYTQDKAYCPVTLLSFMQKMMQTLVIRNKRDESLGYVPYICLQIGEVQRNRNKPCDYTYTRTIRKESIYILALLDIEGTSDSTSPDITKAAKWNGLGDTSNGLAPCWVAEKLQPH